jgi:hypothetical protein
MSFNRPLYDNCEAELKVNESIGPGLYYTNTPVICGNCLPDDPRIIPHRNGASMNSGVDWRFYAGPIDVESDLKNLDRVLSRCPEKKYIPKCPKCGCSNQGQPCGQGVVAGCKMCGTQYSTTKSGSNSGTEPQPHNSKATANVDLRHLGDRCGDNNLVDFPVCRFGIEDTRLSNPPSTLRGTGVNRFNPLCFNPQEKIFFPGELHIPSRIIMKDNHRPCIPSLNIISKPPLPPAEPLPCHKTTPTCDAFNQPMYQYDVCG